MRILSATMAGAACVFVLATGLQLAGAARVTHIAVETADWAIRNLGSSLPLFAAVTIAWCITLRALDRALASGTDPARIDHLDQLTDTWAQLSFGVGVIWTAIGMRDALGHAITPDGLAAATAGTDRLALMVDGGILLALSTTIVGGALGYLMRLTKGLWLGAALRAHANTASDAALAAVVARLRAIEALLEASASSPRADTNQPVSP